MRGDIINPGELDSPRGFSHGILAPAGGRLLFVAGQTAGDAGDFDFTHQFEIALARVLTVVRSAGGHGPDVARMTIFVRNMDAYMEARPQLGDVWARHMGGHYPAVTLVEVSRLVDSAAMVEIEATAVIS